MSRQMTVTVEVSDGSDFTSSFRRGTGEVVPRSKYELVLETTIRADVTFDDIEAAVSKFRAFEPTNKVVDEAKA